METGTWLDGTRQGHEVHYTSLESLLATTYSNRAEKTSVWKKLPDAPLKKSILTVFRNSLVAVGTEFYCSSAIHAYSPSINLWVHVGDLPINCSCTADFLTGELQLVLESRLTSDLLTAKVGGDLHFVDVNLLM